MCVPLRAGLRDQDDESGQVPVLGSQSVAEPGAHAGPTRLLKPGLDEGHRRVVIDGVGVHGLDDGNVINDLSVVREQVADQRARLAVPAKLEQGGRDRQRVLPRGHPRNALSHANRSGKFRTHQIRQLRFVVEQIDLGGSTRLVKENHPLRPGRKVRQIAQTTGHGVDRSESGLSGKQARIQQRRQRRRTDARTGTAKKLAPRHRKPVFIPQTHGFTLW